MRKFFTHNFTKTVITLTAVVAGMSTAHASMPAMNATDHVYAYHLRDVYKDMEAMKNDYNSKLDDTSVRFNDITNHFNSANTATNSRIDGLADSVSNSINHVTNDMGVIKNDMDSTKLRIDSLESSTDKLASDVGSVRNDVSTLKSDTAKGLAQANALSSLKYLGGKGLQISIGTGGYKGQNAIAYGVFCGISDDLMIYAGGTDDSYNGSINIRFK